MQASFAGLAHGILDALRTAAPWFGCRRFSLGISTALIFDWGTNVPMSLFGLDMVQSDAPNDPCLEG